MPTLPLRNLVLLGVLAMLDGAAGAAEAEPAAAAGVGSGRPVGDPYLGLPSLSTEAPPPLLSQTGAFADLATLKVVPALLPYEVNSPLWSDGARKQRWLAVPNRPDWDGAGSAISFSPTGEWYFPIGTVSMKEFDLPLDERDPSKVRRMETRFLVRADDVTVYGITYRWRDDQRDADLLDAGADQDVAVTLRDGSTRTQRWHYPSRAECLTCHNHTAGAFLGINTRQLNRAGRDGSPQLQKWNAMGLFGPPMPTERLAGLPHLTPPDDEHADIAERARSYLDANCSHCHRPGAMPFNSYDARFETPLARQNMINVRTFNDFGIEHACYIRANDPWRSMILVRLDHLDLMKMPPLGRNLPDPLALTLMRAWIASLDGRPALSPPTIAMSGHLANGNATAEVRHADLQATLYYTIDGSAPDEDGKRYTGPLHLTATGTLRVRAVRDGFADSIVVASPVVR